MAFSSEDLQEHVLEEFGRYGGPSGGEDNVWLAQASAAIEYRRVKQALRDRDNAAFQRCRRCLDRVESGTNYCKAHLEAMRVYTAAWRDTSLGEAAREREKARRRRIEAVGEDVAHLVSRTESVASRHRRVSGYPLLEKAKVALAESAARRMQEAKERRRRLGTRKGREIVQDI